MKNACESKWLQSVVRGRPRGTVHYRNRTRNARRKSSILFPKSKSHTNSNSHPIFAFFVSVPGEWVSFSMWGIRISSHICVNVCVRIDAVVIRCVFRIRHHNKWTFCILTCAMFPSEFHRGAWGYYVSAVCVYRAASECMCECVCEYRSRNFLWNCTSNVMCVHERQICVYDSPIETKSNGEYSGFGSIKFALCARLNQSTWFPPNYILILLVYSIPWARINTDGYW